MGYLVNGIDGKQNEKRLSGESRAIARYAEQFDDVSREFVLDFIKWLQSRENK